MTHHGNWPIIDWSRFRRSSAGFYNPFERPVKRMSAAGPRPGGLNSGFGDFRSPKGNKLLYPTPSVADSTFPRDVGFRAHTSGHFCIDKSGAKSTPDIAPYRVPSLHSLTPQCRQNSPSLHPSSNMLPTTIAVTFTAFGAAERED